jgi:cell division protein FtsL
MYTSIFKNIFSKNNKSIRLAVIGSPSSGKTFLLRDIILSLNALEENNNGYLHNNEQYFPYYEGGSKKYGSIAQFGRESQQEIASTRFYFSRQDFHYKSIMRSHKKTLPDFTFEIMNIPGNVFTSVRIEDFNLIKTAIMGAVIGTFSEEEWVSPNRNDRQLLVKYNKNITQKQRENIEYQTAFNKNDIEKQKKGGYLSYNKLIHDLENRGYMAVRSAKINGQRLWNNFYKYETDSVIDAIEQFMNEEQAPIIEQRFTDESGLRNYLSRFYFFYFCYHATDVIICDKLAISEETSKVEWKREGEEIQTQVLNGINLFFTGQCRDNKNFYLVFRGLDALIKQERLQKIFGKDVSYTQRHLIYLFIMILLNKKYLTKIRHTSKEFDDFLKEMRRESFNWKRYFGSAFEDDLKHILLEMVDETKADWLQLFGEQGKDYFVPDTDNEHKTPTVWERIENRINLCEYLLDVRNTNIRFWGIKPHIYFTAFPIHKRTLNISRNKGEGKFDPEINCNDSLLLGTNELVLDILYNADLVNFQWNNYIVPYLLKDMFNIRYLKYE